jgi:arabinosaccharide transport system substrate-binding protein
MKKLHTFLLAVLMLALLVGCSGGNKEEEPAGESVGSDIEGATELTFWTFAGTHAEFFLNAAERWNEEHPDRPIKLTAETYPFDQMHNNLLLALQSGTGAPDLVDIEIAKFSNFLLGDIQLEPLNDLIEPELDKYIIERLKIYSKDGVYYGAPTHLGATVVYYNQEIMDEAGVDIDSIETWDDFVEAGRKVVEVTGKPMTTIPVNWYGIWPFITQRDSDFFDENGELTLDNDINVETLQYIADMVNVEGIAIVSPGDGYHAEEFYGFMNDGGAASIVVPLFYMKDFTEYMPDLAGKMQIRPMPKWPDSNKRTVGMGGTGTAVTKQSEHPELAKEFLYFAKLSEEGSIRLWTELGFDPPRWDVWDSPRLKEDNKYYQFFHDDIFDILLEIRDEVGSVNMTDNVPDVLEEINTNVMHQVLRENRSAKDALEEAAQNVRAKMGQ